MRHRGGIGWGCLRRLCGDGGGSGLPDVNRQISEFGEGGWEELRNLYDASCGELFIEDWVAVCFTESFFHYGCCWAERDFINALWLREGFREGGHAAWEIAGGVRTASAPCLMSTASGGKDIVGDNGERHWWERSLRGKRGEGKLGDKVYLQTRQNESRHLNICGPSLIPIITPLLSDDRSLQK